MTKIVVDTYTFTAASQTVDMPNVSGLQIDGIQLITNLVDNIVIYQFNDPLKGGTLSGTTLTLTYDTTSMSDTDQLMIIYDIPTDSTSADVNITNTSMVVFGDVPLPLSSLTAALPIGVVDGSGNQTGISGNPMIVEPTATVIVPASSAGTAIASALVDDSGNHAGTSTNPIYVTGGGGGEQYVDGTAYAGTEKGNLLEYIEVAGGPTIRGVSDNNPLPSGNYVNVSSTPTRQTGLSVGSEIAASVAIVDGSGNQITSFGGGTEYSTGSAAPTDPTGTAIVFENGSGNWENVGVGGGFGEPLPVNIVSGSSSGTQYAEGDALGATPTGTVIVARDFATDNASVPTTGDVGTKVALHVLPLDSSGDIRPNATLYVEGDAANSADLAPGIAWKDAEGTGDWHITSKTDQFPNQTYDLESTGNTVAMGSTSNAVTLTGLDGYNTASFAIGYSGTGTLISEGSIDGGATYFEVDAIPVNGGAAVSTYTVDGQWQADVTGFTHFRIRCSIVGTSTATVKIRATIAQSPLNSVRAEVYQGGVAVSSSVPLQTKEQSVVGSATVTSSSNDITFTNLGTGHTTALIRVTGTFSATFLAQVSADNGSNYVNLGSSPGQRCIFNVNTGQWIYEITAAGVYLVNISGASAFKLDCAAYTSGTANVWVSLSGGQGLAQGKINHNSVAISASSSGNNTIISATAGKKFKITGWNFIANGTVNAKFTDGAGGADLTGLSYLIANTGLSVPYSEEGWFTGSTNTALVLNLSAAIAVGGLLTYSIVE
jgi:hypothetical protein